MKSLRGIFSLICSSLVVYACVADTRAADNAADAVQPPATVHAPHYQFVDARDTIVAALPAEAVRR